MSDAETPREYEREYLQNLPGPLQVRVGRDTERGNVSRFGVQLEYHMGDAWRSVVRYDHDPDSNHGHDVTDHGLHIDVFRDREKCRTDYVAPPMPASVALDFAEAHLAKNLQRFVQRFEQWHGIRRSL
jgi:hypothetical protein